MMSCYLSCTAISRRVDSSEKDLTVAMFCSDLPVTRCDGDRARLS